MRSDELRDSVLSTMCMTLKQNSSEPDEKIIATRTILPGDVISVTEKCGQTGGGGEKVVGDQVRERRKAEN